MIVDVKYLNKIEWETYSENAHAIAFGTIKKREDERIDYALLALTNDELIGYVTVKEMDSKTVYWQFGGGFPTGEKTIRIWHGYNAFLAWSALRYKYMSTLIENDNLPMLKMAMRAGLRITGVRYFKGAILLEHGIEFSNKSS